MSSLETSLRRALEKGDISDQLYRRRVYEAAAAAMHKSLAAKGAASKEAIGEQNKKLATAIRAIEFDLKQRETAQPDVKSEAQQNAQQAATSAPQVSHNDRSEPLAAHQVDPVISVMREQLREKEIREKQSAVQSPAVKREPNLRQEPNLDIAPDVDVSETRHSNEAPKVSGAVPIPPKISPTDRRSRTKRDKDGVPLRKPFANLLVAAIAVGLLATGLIWIIETGAFQSAESRDTSVPNPPKTLESESFKGTEKSTSVAPAKLGANDQALEDWVTLFSPADPTTIGLVGGATAAIESDPFGDYALLVASGPNAEVQIDIPLSVLRDAGSGSLQISLTARSVDNAPTQMSVTCDFGVLGDCGRRRFNVGQAENEFIFQVDRLDANASAPGILKIKTDIEGKGRAIKLLSARIRTAQ